MESMPLQKHRSVWKLLDMSRPRQISRIHPYTPSDTYTKKSELNTLSSWADTCFQKCSPMGHRRAWSLYSIHECIVHSWQLCGYKASLHSKRMNQSCVLVSGEHNASRYAWLHNGKSKLLKVKHRRETALAHSVPCSANLIKSTSALPFTLWRQAGQLNNLEYTIMQTTL